MDNKDAKYILTEYIGCLDDTKSDKIIKKALSIAINSLETCQTCDKWKRINDDIGKCSGTIMEGLTNTTQKCSEYKSAQQTNYQRK